MPGLEVAAEVRRLGAMVDIVPAERFEPDVGPDADLDPLGQALENLFDGIDEYNEIDDPVLGSTVVTSSISGDLVVISAALAQGRRHHDAGQDLEALWWWQYSYLANWGERASSLLSFDVPAWAGGPSLGQEEASARVDDLGGRGALVSLSRTCRIQPPPGTYTLRALGGGYHTSGAPATTHQFSGVTLVAQVIPGSGF